MQENVLEHFLEEIKCPVCNDYMMNNIAQCIKGHSFCSTCREELHSCPFCEESITATENYLMENFISITKFICVNKTKGCNFQGSAKSTIAHQNRECEYHDFICPIKDVTNCNWRGKIPDAKSHITNAHNGLSTFRSVQLSIEFLEYFNCLFKVLHRRLDNGNLEWCVQYVGSTKNAEKYMFRFEFVDENKLGFEAIFTGLCIPYSNVKDVFHLEKISIHEDTLRRFKNMTSYNYKVTIIRK